MFYSTSEWTYDQMKKKELSILVRIYLYVTALCIMAGIIWHERDLRTLDPNLFAYRSAEDQMFQAVLYGAIAGVNIATLVFGLYSVGKYYYDRSV
jgi:hypothetical protein